MSDFGLNGEVGEIIVKNKIIGFLLIGGVSSGISSASGVLGQSLCVNVEMAELHKEGMESSDMVVKLIRYSPLQKLSKKNGWYQVKDLDDHKAWIREDQVSTSFECAVISNEFANLRTGPGSSFPQTAGEKGLKYLSFRVIQKKSDWVQLEDAEGDLAWVHSPLVWMP